MGISGRIIRFGRRGRSGIGCEDGGGGVVASKSDGMDGLEQVELLALWSVCRVLGTAIRTQLW